MNLHILYNLRTKRHLEIEELAQQLNEKYGTHYEAHQIWGGKITTTNLNLKMHCI